MASSESEGDPSKESVWDYPRPPRLEATTKLIEVVVGGKRIVESRNAFRVLETSHPPVYYIPPADIQMGYLRPKTGQSFCEWKGIAHYYDVTVGDRAIENAAWAYADPTPAFAAMKDHIAFYAKFCDECRVEGEIVTPQPGGFYGGWITSDLEGPFKGSPGTMGW